MKRKRALKIALNMEPYNILKDLDTIQPSISMMQLLVVASKYCSILNSLITWRRQCNKEVYEVNLNLDTSAPTMNVLIDGVMISRIQVDGGSSINLINTDTMDALDLVYLVSMTLVLRMANYSWIKPIGILHNIQTIIARY